MVDACKAQGMPEPEYRVNGGFVTIVFRRPEGAGEVESDSDVVQKDTRNVPEEYQKSTRSSCSRSCPLFKRRLLHICQLIQQLDEENCRKVLADCRRVRLSIICENYRKSGRLNA